MATLKMKTAGLIPGKGVGNSPYWKIVFVNSTNDQQVAVVTYFPKKSEYKVSIPEEGMGGWHLRIQGWNGVKHLVSRELTIFGRLFNRLVSLPLALISGRLS